MDSPDLLQGTEQGVLGSDSSSPSGNDILSRSESSTERKLFKPEHEKSVTCPRCDSINTKFCYYNNYSLSQPRYFCKTCKRYWTKGGNLRNIPVGGSYYRKKKKQVAKKSIEESTNQNPTSITSPIPTNLQFTNFLEAQGTLVSGPDFNLLLENSGPFDAMIGSYRNYDFNGIGDRWFPFGMSSFDGNDGASFTENRQRTLMLPLRDHQETEFMSGTKLWSLDWLEESNISNFGSSWGGMINDCGSSTTNQLL